MSLVKNLINAAKANITEGKQKITAEQFAAVPEGLRVTDMCIAQTKEGERFVIVVLEDKYFMYGNQILTDILAPVIESLKGRSILPVEALADDTVILKYEKTLKKDGEGTYFKPVLS